MNSSALSRLVDWYTAHCDEDWEHQEGIDIQSLDNPGFRLKISVKGTELEHVDFARVEENYLSDEHWFTCWKEDGKFEGAGSPDMLETMIECFLSWAEVNHNPGAAKGDGHIL
jgi:hypothetical protein